MTEPRELTPVQMFWDGEKGVKDFGPRPVPAEEIEEVEEAITPAPKDSSAQESVPSPDSAPESPASAAPVLPASPEIPAAVIPQQQDADLGSGKPNESIEAESATPSQTTQPPVIFSPSSSSATSRGKSSPPAPVKPPVGD